jgi:hypothetical protein
MRHRLSPDQSPAGQGRWNVPPGIPLRVPSTVVTIETNVSYICNLRQPGCLQSWRRKGKQERQNNCDEQ